MSNVPSTPIAADANSFENKDYEFRLRQKLNTTGTITAVTATSPITSTGGTTPNISFTGTIPITKITMNTGKLLGRTTAGVGVAEEITVSTGLSLSALTLTNTGVLSVSGTVPVVVTGTTTPVISVNVFGASGGSHSTGLVPDPGSSAGTKRALFEDVTFKEVLPVVGSQGSITPSTDPNFANVGLLLHFDDAPGATTFLDSSNFNQVVVRTLVSGICTTQTTTKKFGNCALQNSVNSNLLTVTSTALVMGTGDFTGECWIYITSTDGANHIIFGQGSGGVGATQWALALTGVGNSKLSYYANSSFIGAGATTVSLNTWHHVAVARSGTSTKWFLDGGLEGTYVDTNNYSFSTFNVLYGTGSQVSLIGFVDEVRITKGVARYTAAFTAPTTAFPSNTYPTTGPRYQDDFSNTLISNRYIFQSSTVNGITDVGATPNGSGTTGSLTAYNISDVNNASYLQSSINATTAAISSSYYGVGAALPISIQIGSTEIINVNATGVSVVSKFNIDTNGNITKLNNITTSFPSTNSSGYLTNNGSGTYTISSAATVGAALVAGSTTQIQYNNAGAFGASSSFTWNDSTKVLNLGVAGSTASKLQADMNTATLANRFTLQNSVVNGPTIPQIVPNGTSTRSGLNFFTSAGLVNYSSFSLNVDSTTTATFTSGSAGTGTALDMTFAMGTAGENVRYKANGRIINRFAVNDKLTALTSNTTLNETHHTVTADCTGASFTITLPTAASAFDTSSGVIYIVKRINAGANSVTIQGNGAETIDGSNTQILSSQWSSLGIQSTGTSWIIIYKV